MVLSQFKKAVESGSVTKVVAQARSDGYSVIVHTLDTAELIRTHRGGMRVFKGAETIHSTMKAAGVKVFTVILGD